MFRSARIASTIVILSALAGITAAQAAPIKWTLQNVTFNDGGTAVGSFFYDATTNTYSSIAVATTAGSSFGGATYNFLYPGGPSSAGVLGLITNNFPATVVGEYNIPFFFNVALTAAGGTVGILSGPGFPNGDYQCITATCISAGGSSPTDFIRYRFLTGGQVNATIVPIPAAAWLFGAALGLMGVMRRKVSS